MSVPPVPRHTRPAIKAPGPPHAAERRCSAPCQQAQPPAARDSKSCRPSPSENKFERQSPIQAPSKARICVFFSSSIFLRSALLFPDLQSRIQKPRRVSRPQARNKMEIMLSGGSADRKHTLRLASVEFCASGAKLCAQSRRRPFCQESVSFFDSITGMRSGASRLFFVQQEIGKASCRIAECVAVFPRQRHAALRCVVQRHQCHLLFKSTRHALIEHRDSQSQLDHG